MALKDAGNMICYNLYRFQSLHDTVWCNERTRRSEKFDAYDVKRDTFSATFNDIHFLTLKCYLLIIGGHTKFVCVNEKLRSIVAILQF